MMKNGLHSKLKTKTKKDDEEEEGVAEGNDSVLTDKQVGVTTDDMDTIARSVPHSYYLRSLHQPDTVAGIHGPKSSLQLPRTSSDDTNSISMTMKPIKMGVARNYGQLPIPVLPPPPMPRGQSSADLYQSLDTRDDQIRKSKKNLKFFSCPTQFFDRFSEADIADDG